MKNQQGFTLIELVVVIVILGILAAVAVPKFINIQVEARIASVDGLAGAVQSASSLARARGLIEGVNTGNITMEGTVALVNGYPAAASVGIVAALNLDGFTPVYGAAATPPTVTFSPDSYSGTGCTLVYTEAATLGSPPNVANNASVASCQ